MTFHTEIENGRERPTLSLSQPILPAHEARELTKGGTQALIDLDGQTYTLRITRAGKLILTK